MEQKDTRALGWGKVDLFRCWSKPVATGDVSHGRRRFDCAARWDFSPHNNITAILHSLEVAR